MAAVIKGGSLDVGKNRATSSVENNAREMKLVYEPINRRSGAGAGEERLDRRNKQTNKLAETIPREQGTPAENGNNAFRADGQKIIIRDYWSGRSVWPVTVPSRLRGESAFISGGSRAASCAVFPPELGLRGQSRRQ